VDVTPKSPKGWLKTRIFTFGVSLYFFVAAYRSHFKVNIWVEHSKSLSVDDKTSLKWAWQHHVTHFKLLVPLRYLNYSNNRMTYHQQKGRGYGHVTVMMQCVARVCQRQLSYLLEQALPSVRVMFQCTFTNPLSNCPAIRNLLFFSFFVT